MPNPAGVPSLYIHWPFCAAKCPYCDFNVHIAKETQDESLWLKALVHDLEIQLEGLAKSPLKTIYFGGGTPSLMSPRLIDQLLTEIEKHWAFAPNLQISLEVHPTSADAAKFRDFAAAGITRASIGVQSFDDKWLTFLSRDHRGVEAQHAVAQARVAFAQLNLDLMTALPGMDRAAQANQIAQAIETGVDHLSVYQLGIEPGTAFGAAVKRGDWQPKGADEAADFYEAAVAQITDAGFTQYEVSNFAKPGFESQHSLLGWLGAAYVGIGPGAEGRALMTDGTWRHRRTRRSPAAYLKSPLDTDEVISDQERLIEQLIFGLRLTKGLPRDHRAWSLTTAQRLADLVASGDMVEGRNRAATDQGRLRLDAISDYLINHER